tara:strand:+ start:259 stop:387 length:129 start_codon:yes stop_codon:yes gene_type:complete
MLWIQFEQETHTISHVVVDVAVSQICFAVDADATTLYRVKVR